MFDLDCTSIISALKIVILLQAVLAVQAIVISCELSVQEVAQLSEQKLQKLVYKNDRLLFQL